MPTIALPDGAIAMVDDADLAMLTRFKWKHHKDGYAYRTVKDSRGWKNVYMHRTITGAETGQHVDHINRNPLDNTRANLRIVPRWKNSHNRDARNQHSENRTLPRGVSLPKGRNRYLAKIYVAGKRIYLGMFDNQQDAEKAYADAQRRYETTP